jgi:hypothetical protein
VEDVVDGFAFAAGVCGLAGGPACAEAARGKRAASKRTESSFGIGDSS